MTRSFTVLALAALVTGCADTPLPADTTVPSEARNFRFGFGQWDPEAYAPAAGLAVEVSDARDIDMVLGEGLTDEEGQATLGFQWPEGDWVVRAHGEGYHDAWFWFSAVLRGDGDAWEGLPVPTQAGWEDLHAAVGIEHEPGTGLLAVELTDPATGLLQGDQVAELSTAGTIVYSDDDEVPDRSLDSGYSAIFVFNVPPGPAELTVHTETTTYSRVFEVFPDSVSYSIDLAESL